MKQERKIKMIKIAAVGLFSFILTEGVKAQDSIRINLDQALEIALSDNPTIKIANNEIKIQKYAKKEQIAGLFPNIDATGAMSHSIV